MSADLFEAFVGSRNVSTELEEVRKSGTAELPVPPTTTPSDPADTWQPWPTKTITAPKFPARRHSASLWETDDSGRDVLFDANELENVHDGSKDKEDDFGDFEDAVTESQDQCETRLQSLPATGNLLDLDDVVTETDLSAKYSVSHSNVLLSKDKQNSRDRGLAKDPKGQAIEQVVMPVTNFDDDWGDFETSDDPAPSANTAHSRDLLSPSLATENRLTHMSTGPTETKSIRIGHSDSGSRSLVEDTFDDDEPWDDFDSNGAENMPASSNSAGQTLTKKPAGPASARQSIQRDRPSNIPPPAVLLAWIPKIISGLTVRARESNSQSDAAVIALQVYRVSAYIIAGRAARWKRDTILAQSMRMGAAGRSGGMKLTVLDKGEGRKEEQAAEDAIASWTRSSHVLGAAMSRANIAKPPMTLSTKLIARTTTGLDVVSATHACAICGLRRNERVIGIDINVSDVFGEFWTEHWGHSDCADIWYEFNQLLHQR